MDPELASLLRATLEVQAESLRLQRLLVERLLGTPTSPSTPPQTRQPAPRPAPPDGADTPAPVPPRADRSDGMHTDTDTNTNTNTPLSRLPPAPPPSPRPAPPVDDHPSRGARYYQPRPAPAAQTVKPEELELLRRLQQMRGASGLVLQFGPFKGTTLAQVAMGHPEYIRDLVINARRPEVRAAAGQLVEALDAAAEHKPRTPRAAARHAHTT